MYAAAPGTPWPHGHHTILTSVAAWVAAWVRVFRIMPTRQNKEAGVDIRAKLCYISLFGLPTKLCGFTMGSWVNKLAQVLDR